MVQIVRTEQLRKLGNLNHYYLDKFNQTGVFIRHKQGMRNSIAVGDRGEGSLLLGLCRTQELFNYHVAVLSICLLCTGTVSH
jgi:hypothetical protein